MRPKRHLFNANYRDGNGALVRVCQSVWLRLKIVLVLAKAQKTYSRLLSVSMLTVH